MKKKGFTLVELLAVIAILAILVVVAMPNVMGQFRTAKKKTFVTDMQSIIKSSADQYVMDEMAGGGSSVKYSSDDNDTNGKKITTLDVNTNTKYQVEYTSGKITSVIVFNGSYCYKLTGTDIKATSVKADDVLVGTTGTGTAGDSFTNGCKSTTKAE